jgi:hypothetical protein
MATDKMDVMMPALLWVAAICSLTYKPAPSTPTRQVIRQHHVLGLVITHVDTVDNNTYNTCGSLPQMEYNQFVVVAAITRGTACAYIKDPVLIKLNTTKRWIPTNTIATQQHQTATVCACLVGVAPKHGHHDVYIYIYTDLLLLFTCIELDYGAVQSYAYSELASSQLWSQTLHSLKTLTYCVGDMPVSLVNTALSQPPWQSNKLRCDPSQVQLHNMPAVEFDYHIVHHTCNIYTNALDRIAHRLRKSGPRHRVAIEDCLDYAEFLHAYLTLTVPSHIGLTRSSQQGLQHRGAVVAAEECDSKVSVESQRPDHTTRPLPIDTNIGQSKSLWIVFVDTVIRGVDVTSVNYASQGATTTHQLSRLLNALRQCEEVAHKVWAQEDARLYRDIQHKVSQYTDATESRLLCRQIHEAVDGQQWDQGLSALLTYGISTTFDFDVDVSTMYAHCLTARSRHARAVAVWRLVAKSYPKAVPVGAIAKSTYLNKHLYGLEIPDTVEIRNVVTDARMYVMQLRQLQHRHAILHPPAMCDFPASSDTVHPQDSQWKTAASFSLGVRTVDYRSNPDLHCPQPVLPTGQSRLVEPAVVQPSDPDRPAEESKIAAAYHA